MPVEVRGSRSRECSPRAPASPRLASYLKNKKIIQRGSIRIETPQACFGAYVTGSGLIGHRAQTERQLVYGE
jgi:hypothetical protein